MACVILSVLYTHLLLIVTLLRIPLLRLLLRIPLLLWIPLLLLIPLLRRIPLLNGLLLLRGVVSRAKDSLKKKTNYRADGGFSRPGRSDLGKLNARVLVFAFRTAHLVLLPVIARPRAARSAVE